MPFIPFLKQPNYEQAEQLKQELKEHPGLKPRLTFPFPLNENRRTAMKILESGKTDFQEILSLLESTDFVEKRAALFLLENISDFSFNNSEAQQQKNFTEIKKYTQDNDSDIRKAVAQALGHIGEQALPFLEKMSEEDANPYVRQVVAQALGRIGEPALSILREMSKDKDRPVRVATAQALGDLGKSALPILTELVADGDNAVRYKVVQVLGRIGEPALSLLIELTKDNNDDVSNTAIDALGSLGETALPVLEKMSEDENQKIRIRTALSLSAMGEKALPILRRMLSDEDGIVRMHVHQHIINIDKESQSPFKQTNKKLKPESGFHSWLLATQKPLFATLYTQEVISRIEKLQNITKIMQDKYEDKFIGIVVYGSLNKGYLQPESDLDLSVIAQDDTAAEDFHFLAKEQGLPLCEPCYNEISVDSDCQLLEGDSFSKASAAGFLFRGLFFGDHDKLLKLQLNYLQNANEEEWKYTREQALEYETQIGKARWRAYLSEEEIEKAKVALSLLRVPPSYQETLAILKKRTAAKEQIKTNE